MSLKKTFKQLFCKHTYLIVSWSWSHGPTGNDPAFVVLKQKCSHCGKVGYKYMHGKSAYVWAAHMGNCLYRE